MENEKLLIDAKPLMQNGWHLVRTGESNKFLGSMSLADVTTVDAVEVIRCQNCVHAEPLDRNCEINTCLYMHCKLYRGEKTKNVWHKYKKYYKDYSLVERDGFCSDGAKMDGDVNGSL